MSKQRTEKGQGRGIALCFEEKGGGDCEGMWEVFFFFGGARQAVKGAGMLLLFHHLFRQSLKGKAKLG